MIDLWGQAIDLIFGTPPQRAESAQSVQSEKTFAQKHADERKERKQRELKHRDEDARDAVKAALDAQKRAIRAGHSPEAAYAESLHVLAEARPSIVGPANGRARRTSQKRGAWLHALANAVAVQASGKGK